MNAFSRSWRITRLSFGVINKDRELIGFAFLSFIFSSLFAIAMIVPSIVPTVMDGGVSETSLEVYQYVILFLTYFGLALIATFFNVCVVYTTKIRFEGGNASFAESLRFAFSKIGLIVQWSLVSATVGLILRILDNLASRLGKGGQLVAQLIIALIGMTWSIVTIFVVPVLVFEGLGPIPAVKRSTQVIKKTWGESLIRSIGLGLIQLLIFVVIIGATIGLAYLLNSVYEFTGAMIGIGIGVVLLFITGLIFSVANMVYNTALYVYASNNLIANGFDEDVVRSAFTSRSV